MESGTHRKPWILPKNISMFQRCAFSLTFKLPPFIRQMFAPGSWTEIIISHVVLQDEFCIDSGTNSQQGTTSYMNQSIINFWFLNILHLLFIHNMWCISFVPFEIIALDESYFYADWDGFDWCLDYCSWWNHKSARWRSVCDDLLVAVSKGESLLQRAYSAKDGPKEGTRFRTRSWTARKQGTPF